MTRALLLALLCWFSAAAATAGAWPRDKGSFFIAADLRLGWPQELSTLQSAEPTGKYYTFYLEYGLTDRLTLGLDLGRSVSGEGKTVVFLRHPVTRPEARLKIALELGLGNIDGQTVLRPGISLGHSFELREMPGWIALDSVAELSESGGTDLKVDLTLGLSTAQDTKYMLQLQAGAPAERAPFLRLAPSVVIPAGRDRHVELGGTYGITGDASFGIKLGLWQKF